MKKACCKSKISTISFPGIYYLKSFCVSSVRNNLQFIHVWPPSDINFSCLIFLSSNIFMYSCATPNKPSSLPTPIQNNFNALFVFAGSAKGTVLLRSNSSFLIPGAKPPTHEKRFGLETLAAPSGKPGNGAMFFFLLYTVVAFNKRKNVGQKIFCEFLQVSPIPQAT